MKKITILYLLVFGYLSTIAQNAEINKLKSQLFQIDPNNSEKVDLFTDLANEYLQVNLDTALQFANKALTLSKNINYKKGIAKSNRLIGIYHYYQFNYSKSIEFYTNSLKIYNEIGFSGDQAKSLFNIGLSYWKQNFHEQALEYYKKSLKIFKELKNKAYEAECLNNIGLIYWNLGEFNKALDYYNNSLAIFEELKNLTGISRCLFNIGQIYLQRGDHPSALKYCNKSLLIVEELDDKVRIATRRNFIGLIHFNQKNYPQAIENYSKSLRINQKLGNQEGIASCLNNLGLVYWKSEKLNLAIESCNKALKIFKEIKYKGGLSDAFYNIGLIQLDKQNDKLALKYLYDALNVSETIEDRERISYILSGIGTVYLSTNEHEKALHYSQRSLAIVDTLGFLIKQRDVRKQLSDIYAKMEDYNNAYSNYVLYKNLNDSIFNENKIKKLAILEYQYELDKDKQIIAMEQNKKDIISAEKSKQQKLLSTIFILGFILMTALAVITFNNFIKKRKANALLAMQKEHIENANKILTVQKKKIHKIARDLSVANKTKDKFFSIIAHDLRSPMANIMSFGELLCEESNEIGKANKKKFLQIITDEAKMTFSLLDNLLLWASSNTGRISIHPEAIIINEIVFENLNFFKAIASAKNIRLKNSLKIKIEAFADYDMINTVVRNLLSNAIKFTPANGSIEILVRKCINNMTEIGISDSGIGIKPEILSKLFEDNSHITTLGTNNEKGSGLGLQLCKEFIKKNNGKIYAESEPGIGTTFWFSLPVSK